MSTTYPECEKLAAVHDQFTLMMEFLEYINSQGLHLGQWTGHSLEPTNQNHEQIVAGYLGIDMTKVERERAAMLEAL